MLMNFINLYLKQMYLKWMVLQLAKTRINKNEMKRKKSFIYEKENEDTLVR